MGLRLLEVILPGKDDKEMEMLLKDQTLLGIWHEPLANDQTLVRILLAATEAEAAINILEKRYSETDGFRIVLLDVKASIPRAEPPEEEQAEQAEERPAEPSEPTSLRVSRAELYANIAEATTISRVYTVMVTLSAIVAAIGLLRDNVAIVIGAMVIAPLLGPNVALSLATTLSDKHLGWTALKANVAGVLAVLVPSACLGAVIEVDAGIPEIASRTIVGMGDIALGLAAGSAGALAFTTGISTSLIGVMVAVALLPPLVTSGLLMGSGHSTAALGALLLFLTNIICINLAGVTTFVAQGVRPSEFREIEQAGTATRFAIALWLSLLSALVIIILLTQGK